VDLDTAKRVLSLKPTQELDFQLYGGHLEKIDIIDVTHNFAVSGPAWMKFGKQVLNRTKNSKYYCKKLNSLQRLSRTTFAQTRRSKTANSLSQ